MLLVWALLLPTLTLLYVICAGSTGTWLHHYLIQTSNTSEYSHDHRMCVWASLVWPIPLTMLGLVYIGRFIKYIYNYPSIIFKQVHSRRKTMETGKR